MSSGLCTPLPVAANEARATLSCAFCTRPIQLPGDEAMQLGGAVFAHETCVARWRR